MKDRDVYTPKHPTPTAVPAFVCEEATGKYEGPELAAVRARRPTDERIGRLETKHDKLTETVGHVEKTVANMAGKLDTFLDVVASEREQSHRTERVRIGSRAKVIVGCATALGVIAGAIATIAAGGCS